MLSPPTTPQCTITLPAWLQNLHAAAERRSFSSSDDRMRLAIEASRLGSAAGDGGPFGAAVFELSTHRLISIGANFVLATGYTALHAEVVALTLAQAALGRDATLARTTELELMTSAEPCAMCLGAVMWAGVRRLVCGARDEDVRAVGFDEGDKPPDWPAAFRRRGIDVRCDVLRTEAVSVLQAFRASGGALY